jgi:hypothetical protein
MDRKEYAGVRGFLRGEECQRLVSLTWATPALHRTPWKSARTFGSAVQVWRHEAASPEDLRSYQAGYEDTFTERAFVNL